MATHDAGRIVGVFDRATAGHPRAYYEERGIFLDCRGKLQISPRSSFGYGVKIITASHIHNGRLGRVFTRFVRVDHHAWVASFAILYACHIGEGAVVGMGAAVKNLVVAPYTMVDGNPAVVVARLNRATGTWIKEGGGWINDLRFDE